MSHNIDFTTIVIYTLSLNNIVPSTTEPGSLVANVDISSYPVGTLFLCNFYGSKYGTSAFCGINILYNSFLYTGYGENGAYTAQATSNVIAPITKVSGQNTIGIYARANSTEAIVGRGYIIATGVI